MKPFKENDLTVLSDVFVERSLEEAISCLLESGGDVTQGAKHFQERKKVLSYEIGDRYNSYLADIDRLLKERGEAVKQLMNLLGLQEKGWLTQAGFEIPDNVFDQMICPKDMKVLNRTPAGLCLSILAGYTISVNTGITSGLMAKNRSLYNMVCEIWRYAIEELHPFQRGPTHQGTKHCIQVLNNLDALKQDLKITNFPVEAWAMLHIAAALHDIGKGDILADVRSPKHAQNGAKVIEDRPASLKLGNDFKDFVAAIVRTHNPESPIHRIDGLGYRDICAPAYGISIKNVDMEGICALFQLADVIDITRDRVSAAIFEMLEDLYSSPAHPKKTLYDSVKEILDARKGIVNWTIVIGTDSHIKVYMSPDTSLHTAVNERIKKENDDLKDTGATCVLQGLGWPYGLRT